jgi:ubiquinone/menaquinone biosynthesis C-methylase UbiE
MLTRILEPEVMDSEQDASEYNSMDHSEVNRRFVDDLLTFASTGWSRQAAISEARFQDNETAGAACSKSPKMALGDVLDVGTGTALIPVALCKQHSACRIMAVDMAVSMLNLAVYNVEASGLRERIQLAQIDAKRMIFPDAMFDVVMSNSIIHHLPVPKDCVAEMVRVLRPDGMLFVRDLMRPADQATLTNLVQTYAGNESDYSRQLFADSLRAALTLEEMRELVAGFGFPAESVSATSDRHWTWAGTKETLSET